VIAKEISIRPFTFFQRKTRRLGRVVWAAICGRLVF
jgi:hypothetical protein